MKRLFIILAAAMMAANVLAETKIPTVFGGIRLGYSSKSEVETILKALNCEKVLDSLVCFYTGNVSHEDIYFSEISAQYVADTLIFIGYRNYCESDCVDYGKPFLTKFRAKYENLAKADTSFLYNAMLSGLPASGIETWGRTDGNTIVMTMNTDSVFGCCYMASSRCYAILNTLFNGYTETALNFAEENKVTGVAGVKFGDSKEVVKRVMASKNFRLLESDDHSILYVDATIGGVTYDFARFYFKAGEGLISANLQKAFREWKKEEAVATLESIVGQYGRKYTNMKLISDEGNEKLYKCGAYIDGYKYPPIFITFSRSLSKGGFFMYYVQVDYYEMKRKTLYDDEI